MDGCAYYFAKVSVRFGGKFVSKPGDIMLGYENDMRKMNNVLTLMRKQTEEKPVE